MAKIKNKKGRRLIKSSSGLRSQSVVVALSDTSNGGTEQAEGNPIIGMVAKELMEEILFKEHGEELHKWLSEIIEKADSLLAGVEIEVLEELYNKKKKIPDFSLAIALTKAQQKENDA